MAFAGTAGVGEGVGEAEGVAVGVGAGDGEEGDPDDAAGAIALALVVVCPPHPVRTTIQEIQIGIEKKYKDFASCTKQTPKEICLARESAEQAVC